MPTFAVEKTPGARDEHEYRPLLPPTPGRPPRQQRRARRARRALGRVCETMAWSFFLGFALCAFIDMYFHRRGAWWWPDSDLSAASLETCAWSHLAPHVGLLDVAPVGREEYLGRQGALAAELRAAGADAFIAEPSASSAYYANISYEFDLSERPFLVIVDKDAHFSYLVPKFEAGRIAGLEMVYSDKTVIEWAEEESPYQVLANATGYSKVILDEHARFMIAAGLQKAGIEVVPMNELIQSLRSVKTEAEIEILRGINSFTLELIRSLQKCIKIGLTQETVVTSAEALFTRAGVGRGFWSIVLFGDQAAYPHGGKHGKTLQPGEYVLIDIGSKLHDYGSDVTRTILPTGAQVSDELKAVWKTVYESQAAGFNLMRPNQTCSEIDSASRKPISDAGYAEFYTHRLGHGLGLEMHEHPYLNGANSEKLKVGQVVSNEPVSLLTSMRMTDPQTIPLTWVRASM
jgi:Xaa-Pro aminopeptidase